MEQFEEILIPEIEINDKRHGRRRFAVWTAAACAIVLIAAGFLVIRWYGSEERALVKGMLNLAEEVKERQALWETASGNAPEDPFGAMKMTTVFNVSSEELPVTLGVDTVFLRDAKARRLRADTEISVMNNKLAGVSLIGLDHTLIVTIPAFFRQNLELDTQRIDRQYNDSLFAEKFGRIEDLEVSLDLFPEETGAIWRELYGNLSECMEYIRDNGIQNGGILNDHMYTVEIEKLEKPLVISVPEKDNKQYQCSQYRIEISYGEEEADAPECMVLLAAVDENDRIVQITLEETDIMIRRKSGESDPAQIQYINLKLTGSVNFLGEERSIDDIIVNMQAEIPLYILPLDKRLLSVFGNRFDREEETIEIQAGAEIVYDENDSSVTTQLHKLTVAVDRIGSFKVTGKAVAEPLREAIAEPEGETIRLFEITGAQYQDLEAQFWQRIWRWLKAIGRD